MNTSEKSGLQEIFGRILKKLGEMGDFFVVAAELSRPSSAAHSRILSWLLTQSGYANLKEKFKEQKFFLLTAQLADLDQKVHAAAGQPEQLKPSEQVKRLLDDPALYPLLPRLIDQNDLKDILVRLGENKDGIEGLVRRLVMETEGDEFPQWARQVAGGDELGQAVKFLCENESLVPLLANSASQALVLQLSKNGLYGAMQRLAALQAEDPLLIDRLAQDDPPLLANLQQLARHPELDGLLAALLRQLANDGETHTLPEDEEFASLVIDLAECQAVKDDTRRDQFYELARGLGEEPKSQELAHKILFTTGFTDVAYDLAPDGGLVSLVRRMQKEEHHKKVADKLKAGGDSAQVILSVAEEAEFARTIQRMCEDKVNSGEFNPLVYKLRDDDHFFEQINALSKDEILMGIHRSMTDRNLTPEGMAQQLKVLGDQLLEKNDHEQAINAYKIALLLNSDLREAYFGRARAWKASNIFSKAVEDYKTLTSTKYEDCEAWLCLGETYLEMHRARIMTPDAPNWLDEAREAFTNALTHCTDKAQHERGLQGLHDVASLHL